MSDIAKKFTENWKKAFPDKEPNVNAALGYDSFMLLADAITRAGKAEPNAIRDALEVTKGFPGVTGAKTINKTHDAESPVGVVQIKDGKKQFVGTVTPQL